MRLIANEVGVVPRNPMHAAHLFGLPTDGIIGKSGVFASQSGHALARVDTEDKIRRTVGGINVNAKEIAGVQTRYDYLANHAYQDPCVPIDPMSYIDSDGDHLLHIAASLGDRLTVALLVTKSIG